MTWQILKARQQSFFHQIMHRVEMRKSNNNNESLQHATGKRHAVEIVGQNDKKEKGNGMNERKIDKTYSRQQMLLHETT